jgi:hypothetical protein
MGQHSILGFIHLQKTAGITVTWIMRSSFGSHHLDLPPARHFLDPVLTARELQHWGRFYGDLRSFRGHSVVPYTDVDVAYPQVRYFTLLRDPVKRMASWFQYQVQQKRSGRRSDVTPDNVLDEFETWIQQDFRHNWQTRRIAGRVDVDAAIKMIRDKEIFVGLVEQFDESMLLLKGLVSSDLNIGYSRRNVAVASTIAKTLLESERARQLLVEANDADLQLYEYAKAALYPSYRQEYGDQLQEDLQRYRASSQGFNYLNVTRSRLKYLLLVVPSLYLRRRDAGVE